MQSTLFLHHSIQHFVLSTWSWEGDLNIAGQRRRGRPGFLKYHKKAAEAHPGIHTNTDCPHYRGPHRRSYKHCPRSSFSSSLLASLLLNDSCLFFCPWHFLVLQVLRVQRAHPGHTEILNADNSKGTDLLSVPFLHGFSDF